MVPFTFPFAPEVNVCATATEVNATMVSRRAHTFVAPTRVKLPFTVVIGTIS